MDVAKIALAGENFLGPFAVEEEGSGKDAKEFDDLSDVVIVFAVFGARLGVEEVVTCDQFEDLENGESARLCMAESLVDQDRHTIAAMLQTSVLAPHLAPRITSGDRYCRVWMSFVKW